VSDVEKLELTDDEWRERLSPDQYAVLRQGATEPPWMGRYVDEKGDGIYRCAACGNELFDARAKFESGSGWPSFTDPVFEGAVDTKLDTSHGMVRTEAVCARCGGHLGHVFDDGPIDRGGMRWCINGCALDLAPREG
jgi:peptide-methionine (R)-S-oxide reductase